MNKLTTEKQDEKQDHGNAMETRSFEVIFSVNLYAMFDSKACRCCSGKINSFSQNPL